jgi:hypothetical protein
MPNFIDYIRTLANTNQQVYSIIGTISKIDMVEYTCTVEPIDDKIAPLTGVLFNPSFIPSMSSEVIVSFLDNDNAFISNYNDLQLLDLKTENEDLKSVLSDMMTQNKALCDALSILTVTCSSPGSPSSPPVNTASFTAIKAQYTSIDLRLNNLLK